MRKTVKKLITFTAAAFMAMGAFSFAACSPNFTPPSGYPDGKATSNGGFVVSVGDGADGYYYFINGVGSSTSDNTYGVPVKGALMRVKKGELKENNAETVIPSLMVAGDTTAGIFVYNGRVYYATPSTVRDTKGVVQNSRLDFKSAKLDGTGIQDLFRLASNTTVYRFVDVGGTVYVLYAEGTSSVTMHSFNTTTKKDTVLFDGATDYVLDSTDKENPVVYYTMGVTDVDVEGSQPVLYNQVYCVSADATKAPYEYNWSDKALEANDGEAPYTNLGTIVLDGIGTNDKKLDNFNHSESTPHSPVGYVYELRTYQDGALYLTIKQTNGSGGDLYYLPESAIGEEWDSVDDNPASDGKAGKLTKIANAIEAGSTATENAYFYTEGEGESLTHHYLYVSNSSMYRADVGEGGFAETTLEIAYDIGSAKIVSLAPQENGYGYVYFTRTNSAGLSVERAVYNGKPENYTNLTYDDENNDAYKPVKLLDVQHVSGWYDYEIVDDVVFYADAESFGGSTYSYVNCISLKNGEGDLMDNVELKAFGDLYDSVVNNSDKTVGLFAKLNDAFGDSDLSNAIRYYFYTGKSGQFDANIEESLANGEEETALYTAEEKEAFAAFVEGKGYTLKKNNQEKVLFTETSYFEGETSFRTLDYFRTCLGKRTAEDEASYAEYWKSTVLNHYVAPEKEESSLAWWAWLLIAIGIVEVVSVVVFAVTGTALWYTNKKKNAPKTERLKVVTKDDRDIDVYADEEPEEPEEEPAPEEAVETEEAAEPEENEPEEGGASEENTDGPNE